MNTRFRILAAAAALLVLAGCEATDPVPDTANLGIEVEPLVGAEAYTPSQVYIVDGRAMTFSAARVYLSDVTLVSETGTEVRVIPPAPVTLPAYDASDATVQHTVSETVTFAPLDLGTAEATLGEVPAGRYTGARFNVGLAGMTNRVDATQAPVGHPLAVRTDRGNWWSWNVGYIFSMTEGRVDLDGDGSVTGVADADWFIHLGTSRYVVPVVLDEAFDVAAGGAPMLHVQLDLAHLLEEVDLGDPAQRECMSFGCDAVANAVTAHIPDAFHFHGVHAD